MALSLEKTENIEYALDKLYEYFEDLAGDEELDDLQELYNSGVEPRSQDELLWEIVGWTEIDAPTVSLEKIERINTAVDQLQRYPKKVKRALKRLSGEIKRQLALRAKAEGRNVLSASLAGLLDNRNTRSLRANQPIETALNRARLTPWFTGHMSKFLSGAPRAGPQSEGTINPLMINLKRMAEGKHPLPLRSRGRGTRTARASPGRTTRRGHRAGPGRGPGRNKTVKNMFVA